MGLKGKFIRREGTTAIFGSRAKPEWKPIEISGQVDPMGLESGAYYEIELESNRMISYQRLPPPDGGRSNAPAQGAHQGSSRPDVVSRASLMASATGFAKSAMEGGIVKSVPEAIRAGLLWAGIWGDAPAPQSEQPPPPPPDDPLEPDW